MGCEKQLLGSDNRMVHGNMHDNQRTPKEHGTLMEHGKQLVHGDIQQLVDGHSCKKVKPQQLELEQSKVLLMHKPVVMLQCSWLVGRRRLEQRIP